MPHLPRSPPSGRRSVLLRALRLSSPWLFLQKQPSGMASDGKHRPGLMCPPARGCSEASRMERQFPYHSECSLGTSSLSITWELVRGTDTLRLHPDLCLRICPESASPGDPFACEGLRTMALEQLFSTLVAHQNPLGRFKNLGILGSCPSPTAGRGSRVTSNAATLEDSSSPTLSMALTSAGEPSFSWGTCRNIPWGSKHGAHPQGQGAAASLLPAPCRQWKCSWPPACPGL